MKLKPTIYLGLGGTGNLAISFAKRMYEDEYGKGNLPPSVAFVTVDFQTDMDKDPGLATNITNNFIKIESASNPKEFYRVRRENQGQYTWMFDGNTGNIDNRISKGAKAVRTTGRLYTEMVLESVMNRLGVLVNEVTNVDTNAEVAAGVNIHMVMSLAGGTGAGSFITIANAIKKKYSNSVNLYGYGVTHSIFRAMDVAGTKTPNVELNAISSIIDLDYLQTASDSNPIQVELGAQKITLREPAFDGFYVIDNTSENGYTLRNVKSLCEVIGTCLYACGAEAGEKVENIINNVGPKEGKHHVGPKLGWVQGLGACQVVYKSDLMAETYSLKSAIELIRKIRQESADIQQDALKWTEEVAIREDGDEYNMLIDNIYSPRQIQTLKGPLIDQSNTEASNKDAINKYIVSLINFPTDEVINERIDDLKNKLDKKIRTYLSTEGGVGNSIKFLASLLNLCKKYQVEMTEELRMINGEKDEKSSVLLEKAFVEYKDRKHGRFYPNSKARNQDLLDDIIGRPAKNISRLLHEAKRREVARNIFAALISKIEILLQSLKDRDAQLEQISDMYSNRLTSIQSVSPDALVFEYDISYQDRLNITVDSRDIIVSDFVRKLPNTLLEINDIDELSSQLLSYASSLPKTNDYRNTIITEVIDNMTEAEYNKLKDEISRKSARWLKINDRGQCVNSTGKSVADAIAKNWVVSVYKQSPDYKSRLHKDISFLQNVESKDFLYVDKEVAKQRMIFCRIDGSLIPYCIDVVNEMAMDRYDTAVRASQGGDAVFNPHFDRILFEKMREEDFKLKPEMKNEAIFYWVCGHIFGWDSITEEERKMNKDEKGNVISESGKELADHTKYVCCLRKKYMYWDVNALAGKDKQWTPLGNTGRRDTAYNTFKTQVLPEHKENFKRVIQDNYLRQKAWWENEIKRIIDAGLYDYIDKIVCSDKSSVTYMSSNGGEFRQIQEEFQYLSKDLLNALGNLK